MSPKSKADAYEQEFEFFKGLFHDHCDKFSQQVLLIVNKYSQKNNIPNRHASAMFFMASLVRLSLLLATKIAANSGSDVSPRELIEIALDDSCEEFGVMKSKTDKEILH